MAIETVYQVVHFDAVNLNDPEAQEVVKEWNDGEDLLPNMPQDILKQLQEENTYLLLNKSTGEIGAVNAAPFALNYEHEDPTQYDSELRSSVIQRIVDKVSQLNTEDEEDSYYRGINDVLTIIREIQAGEVD